ncbi:MAG: flippase-like domain-containing protein [Chitinispirillaceae bacterium]|nr:flippase-like domain-containing protein [Chitinispirillaceae bacterium]
MKNTGARRLVGRIVTIVLAVAPLVWIFWRLDFSRLWEYIPLVAWWTIPALCGFILFSTFLQGVRWWIVLRALVPELSFLRTMSYHLIGVFYSIVLPTSASADVVKTVLLSRNTDYSISWGAIVLCRMMGFFTLIMFSVYGLLTIDKRFLPQGFWVTLGTVSVLMSVIAALSFFKRFSAPLRPLAVKIMPPKVFSVVDNLRQGIYLYRNKTGMLFSLFLVTVFLQVTLILLGCVTLYGVAGKFMLAEYFAFIPIIEIIANAGPTPNGIGVREALTAVFFKYMNISNEQLGIYVFITLFFAITLRLVGGIPVLHGMMKKKGQ